MDWVKGFFIPIVELTFIGAFGIFIIFIVIRAYNKVYKTKLKWFLKYTIMRNEYNPVHVKCVLDAMEKEMDYYDAKKFLMIKGIRMETVDEIMWIYDKIFKELQGGKNGQGIAGSNSKTQRTKTTSLPSTE